MQSNIDKITELRTALDNGTLSEEEAYQAKSDLLEIQDSLTESYGNQVQGLDLINDSLDTQIAKLKELSTGESKRFLNENKKGVEEAEKQMEKERHAYLGQYSDNGSEESNAINQAIAKLKKKYGDDVFKLQEGMEGTGNFEIEFNADASTAKDALNDFMNEIRSIQEHYSMQTDALDKLSADMSEDLDKWINTISSNMEEMTTAINDAVKNAGLSTAGTINAISSILRHYRLSDSEISQSGLTNITGYASGTNYVNKSGIYRVNEKGMESVFSKQYGTLTFLNQGDKVFDANFTKQLLDNSTIATQKNMPDYAGMAKAIEKNIQNIQNLSGNTYVNNFYIDGAQDTESILREIDKHLDKKIQAHDKKQVRDFKSLR